MHIFGLAARLRSLLQVLPTLAFRILYIIRTLDLSLPNFHYSLVLMVFGLGGVYGSLALLSRSQWQNDVIAALSLMALGAVMVAAYCLWLKNRPEILCRSNLLIITATLYLISSMGQPLFEDDYFRYMWDGYITMTTGSAYGVPPAALFSDVSVPLFLQTILGEINHPEVATIYGPTLQVIFALSYWVAPGEIWPLQGLFLITTLVLVYELTLVAPLRFVLLFAWSPLVIKEVILTIHPDIVGVALLFTACILSKKGKQKLSAVVLAISIGAKVFAIPFVPFLLKGASSGAWLLLILMLGILYLPHSLNNAVSMPGLMTMAEGFEFNSALFGLIHHLLPTNISKGILVTMYLALLWFFYRRLTDQRSLYGKQSPSVSIQGRDQYPELLRGDILIAGLLLCSPVINAWYLLWLLPFAVVRPLIAYWVASLTVLLTYLVPVNFLASHTLTEYIIGYSNYQALIATISPLNPLNPYDQALWLRVLEFALIGIAGIWDLNRYRLIHK